MTDDNAAYMKRMQADDGISIPDLLAAYANGFGKLHAAIADMSPHDFRARPVPRRWSTLEVVGHIADCEQMIADRLKRTLSITRPLLIGFDPTGFPAALRYNEREVVEFMELFQATRTEMHRVLSLCSENDWQRDAIHSESGLVTLRQITLQAVRHVEHHLPFIAEKRAALGG